MRANNSLTEKRLFEFGPFRINTAERVLESAGKPISVAPKALDVLIVLIERRGHLVEKEDLISRVWPDTFVEENNLAFNISVLRKLLGETGAAPRYIETVPKRGYRFVGEVNEVLDDGQDEPPVPALHLNGKPSASGSPDALSTAEPVKRKSLRRWLFGGPALTAAAIGIVIFFFPRSPKLTDRDVIVVADFVNQTGEPIFDDTLRQGLTAQLEQSPFLSLVSEPKVRQTLRLMSQPPDVRLTAELARDVCERAGGAAVLEGSIRRLGRQYILGLSAKNCRTGEILYYRQVQAADKEEVLPALSQIVLQFRSHVGESLAMIRSHNTPLADATTQSMEALEAYSAAWKIHEARGASASLPLFKRAAEIDPQFAMAHASLGRTYMDLDQSDLSAASISKAWQLRDRASDRERFFITVNYAMLVTGNMEHAHEAAEAWAQTYTRDPIPHALMSGMINKIPGRYEKAAAEAERSIERDPDFGIPYYNLAVNNAYLNRFEEAEKSLLRGKGRGLDCDEFHMLTYDLAFLNNDSAGMERLTSKTRSWGESWLSNKQAFALAYAGHLRQARSVAQSAVAEALQDALPERAALSHAGAAVRAAFFGYASDARTSATAALGLSHSRDIEFGAAFAFALLGDSLRSQTIANHLAAQSPESTSVQFSYLPVLRALFAINHGEAAKALELLQPAAPFEFGTMPSSMNGTYGALYPAYVRGQAYIQLGRGLEAAMEFQKILDHRGVVLEDPVGVLAHLQLGRAFALAGEKAKAKMAYARFLDLWKAADPDIPLLREARAEYARL